MKLMSLKARWKQCQEGKRNPCKEKGAKNVRGTQALRFAAPELSEDRSVIVLTPSIHPSPLMQNPVWSGVPLLGNLEKPLYAWKQTTTHIILLMVPVIGHIQNKDLTACMRHFQFNLE